MKIAFFEGSFNPFHEGHLNMAKYLIDKNIVDRVHIMPSPCSPFKINDGNTVNADIRGEIIKASIPEKYTNLIKLDNFESEEFPNQECTYSVDVFKKYLTQMRNYNLGIKPFYIMGADSYNNIEKYKDYNWFFNSSIRLIVFARPGEILNHGEHGKSNVIFITDYKQNDASSSVIREKIKNEETIDNDELSESALNIINKYNLYK